MSRASGYRPRPHLNSPDLRVGRSQNDQLASLVIADKNYRRRWKYFVAAGHIQEYWRRRPCRDSRSMRCSMMKTATPSAFPRLSWIRSPATALLMAPFTWQDNFGGQCHFPEDPSCGRMRRRAEVTTSTPYSLSMQKNSRGIDWWLFLATLPILAAGLVTMHSFTGDDSFAVHQIIWIAASLLVFLRRLPARREISAPRLRFGQPILRFLLVLLGSFSSSADISRGQSWISFGAFSFQPSDFAKMALIIILAKYFSRRHIEIANIRHILVSGVYTFIFFILVLLHPDLGSA